MLLAAGAKTVEEALADRLNAGCWRPWKGTQGQGHEQGEGAWAARPVNVGGLRVHLFLLERTGASPCQPSPPQRSSKDEEEEKEARRSRY